MKSIRSRIRPKAPRGERSELVGTILEGKYLVGDRIGTGGTGIVFSAIRLADDAEVVIKTLRTRFAESGDLCRRLRREGEVARRVHHPAIVRVFDEGMLHDGSPFIVMERIEGEGLNQILRREGTLEIDEALLLVRRVCDVLHHAHAKGYVHRDVKPEHIILSAGPQGLEFRLLDFGVCAADSAPHDERERERGRVYGTPNYVSPEQASGDPDVDGRADVFGLGVCLFEMLLARVPFSGRDVTQLLRRIIREDAPRAGLLDFRISREVDALIAKMIARVPEERFASARAVSRAVASLELVDASTETRLLNKLRSVAAESEDETVEALDGAALLAAAFG